MPNNVEIAFEVEKVKEIRSQPALPADLIQPLVHQQFEYWAELCPHAVAVRYRDQMLTYRQLNDRANQLAGMMSARGISFGNHVVVCVEPGFSIVTAILAIFKVGAVYVPLDPTYPLQRIQAILEDISPVMVVSQQNLLSKIAAFHSAQTIALDSINEADALGANAISVSIDLDQSATIFFTSGTTGKPKGVVASYANVASYIEAARGRYQFGPGDSIPAIARFGFSISVFELLLPLSSGGALVILDREHILDFERLTQTLSEVTFFHAGPSLLKSLLAYIKQQRLPSLRFQSVRHASSGGDMIPPEVLEDLKHTFTQAEVFVIYGCSEISCMGCTYPVPRDETIQKTYVGSAFEGMNVLVLDSQLQEVKTDEIGEVYFAGKGVVKGYWNRPELTQQKFIQWNGLRYYATGDVGRKNKEGLLELLGRADFQIKIRGMRIEPTEVEYFLRKAPGVQDGLVAAKNRPGQEKMLVAYVVFRPDSTDDRSERISAIRKFLSDQLPDYMVPTLYFELPSLPLNHNMKVDRKALPEPDWNADRSGGSEIREPTTSTEIRIASIWKKLLNIQRIGIDDYFFELGGYSLLAIEFIAELNRMINVRLDGLDVIRENLEVLASICDRQLGIKTDDSRQAEVSRQWKVDSFHFGSNRELVGTLTSPEKQVEPTADAVLICGPIGHEDVRAQFVLNQFAKTLARQGVPVFRFDYYGCGDSLGDLQDARVDRWKSDIKNAYLELKKRTSAKNIIGLGVRLGATLLSEINHELGLPKVVYWDPLKSGHDFYRELKKMQESYRLNERSYRWKERVSSSNRDSVMEFSFSAESLQQLKQLSIPMDQQLHPVVLSPYSWTDIAQMNDVFPDCGLVRTLTEKIRGM